MLLPFHVFNHNIINISKGGAVFKYLPWRVGVEVDFDERFISDGKQAIACNVCSDVFVDGIFGEGASFDQKLGIEFVFKHKRVPFCFYNAVQQ